MRTKHCYCGIDPGLEGAMACIWPDESDPVNTITIYDTPTVSTGTKRDYDANAMTKLLLIPQNAIVGIELVHSMPKQGVASSFRFGYGFGLWIGILAALGIRYEFVTPQRWKKALLDGMPKEKGASILAAKRMFPSAADQLNLAKHHGRADSLMIAAYTRGKNR